MTFSVIYYLLQLFKTEYENVSYLLIPASAEQPWFRNLIHMVLKLGHFLYMKEEEYKKCETELAYARYMEEKENEI